MDCIIKTKLAFIILLGGKSMKLRNLIVVGLLVTSVLLTACDKVNETSQTEIENNTGKKVNKSEQKDEDIVLKYWTWYPNADQFEEVIREYQKKNPHVKIDLNVMESKAYQEKLPIALATNEDIDLAGVQPTAMAGQIKTYLSPLEPLLKKYVGEEWDSNYSSNDIKASKSLTDNELYMLSIVRAGAMIGYYNAEMLEKYNLEVPTTIEEYKVFADKLKEADPSIMPASFAGKDAWVCDELMLTIMGQTSDYYNKWRYDGAPVNSQEYINAMNDFKTFFDLGIFSKDVFDLDYGRAYEMFTSGKAATFFQGTWEGGLLSPVVRESKQIDLKDVGCFPLPVVHEGGAPSLRSYLDAGVGIVASTEHEEEATKFLNYIVAGDGLDLLAKHFIGTPGKLNFEMDSNLLKSEAEKNGFELMTKLVQEAIVDRNNVSGFSDVEGASIQRIILDGSTADDEVEALQKEWESGKY